MDLCDRLSGDLDRVQCERHDTSLGATDNWSDHANDDQRFHLAYRDIAGGSGRGSVHTPERGLPPTLPYADVGFLLTEWKDGVVGAWRMGVKHGLICLGCCWALMGLLFVAGVMNIAWVAALTAAVVIEKLHPSGVNVGKFLGAVLIVTGVVQIATLSGN